jgi:PhnB protein
MQTVVPMLAYEDGVRAIDWLTHAFGFRENEDARFMDNGTVTHAELDVGDGSIVFLATPTPAYESPAHHRETCEQARRWQDNPWVIDGVKVTITDLDAHAERAPVAGATILREPEDVSDVGLRIYTAEDFEGHRWMFTEQL